MRMRGLAVAAFVLVALVLGAGTSTAEPEAVPVDVSTASVTAWECAAGDFCAWTGRNGTGSRCAWTNADPDWRSGSVQCSWSGTQRVQSYWNRGTSTSFRGVKLYLSANFGSLAYCVPQGTAWNVEDGGTFLRSHQWGTWTPNTCGP